jgi:hypothetical protein
MKLLYILAFIGMILAFFVTVGSFGWFVVLGIIVILGIFGFLNIGLT